MFHLILFQNPYGIFGWMMHILRIQQFLDFSWNTEHFLTCSVMFMYIVVPFGNVYEGAFLWDQDQWSEIIWIVVHELQRNWWICDQSGFIGFLWYTMIWMVFDRWSLSRSPQRNTCRNPKTLDSIPYHMQSAISVLPSWDWDVCRYSTPAPYLVQCPPQVGRGFLCWVERLFELLQKGKGKVRLRGPDHQKLL